MLGAPYIHRAVCLDKQAPVPAAIAAGLKLDELLHIYIISGTLHSFSVAAGLKLDEKQKQSISSNIIQRGGHT